MSSSSSSAGSSSGGGLISKTVHALAQTLGIEKQGASTSSTTTSSSGGGSSSGLTAAAKSYAVDMQPGRRKSVPGIIPDGVAAAHCQGMARLREDHEIGSSSQGRFTDKQSLEYALYAATMDEKIALEQQQPARGATGSGGRA